MAAKSLELIYSQFPTLVAQDRKCRLFSWLVNVGQCPIIVKFVCPNFPSTDGLKLIGDEDALFLLQNNLDEVRALADNSASVAKFLAGVENIFKKIETSNPGLRGAHSSDPAELERSVAVLDQLSAVGWDHVGSVSRDLTQVKLTHVDARERSHSLQLNLPLNYPAGGGQPVVGANLPDGWDLELDTSHLGRIYDGWVEAVDSYQDVWRELEELDRCCWCLDPDPPTRAHLYRRIVVAASVSLHITIDPSCPSALPVVRFLGADARISPLRQCLSSNHEMWDPADPVLTNLERVLGVEMPGPADSNREEWGVECGICYTYKLEDRLPNKTCDDTRCCQPFHDNCLFEWLRTMPNARSTLNTVFGDCPYCSRPIQCQRPDNYQ